MKTLFLANLIGNLPIRKRIFIGFASLTVISLFIVIVNLFSLINVERLFGDYTKSISYTRLMSEVEADIIDLNRKILVFRLTDTPLSINDIQVLLKSLKTSINALSASDESNQKSAEIYPKFRDSIENLSNKTSKLNSERNFLKQLHRQLEQSFDKAYTMLDTITKQHKKNEGAILIYEIHSSIAVAENQATRYFQTRANKIRLGFIDNYTIAKNDIELYRQLKTTSEKEKQLLNNLSIQLDDIKNTFFRTMQADRNFIFLVNVVIAGEATELKILSEHLKDYTINKQTTLISDTNLNLNLYKLIAFIGSFLLMFVAILISGRVSRAISEPITDISNTFRDISDGREVKLIPGTDRDDEIGTLAKSATLFKENADKTNRLLKATKELADTLSLPEIWLSQH